jgi:hypothetical protein
VSLAKGVIRRNGAVVAFAADKTPLAMSKAFLAVEGSTEGEETLRHHDRISERGENRGIATTGKVRRRVSLRSMAPCSAIDRRSRCAPRLRGPRGAPLAFFHDMLTQAPCARSPIGSSAISPPLQWVLA